MIQTAQHLEGTKLSAAECIKLNTDLNCTIADLKRTIQERDSTIAQLDKNVASLKKYSGDQASEISELEEFRVLHASAKRASEREAKQIVRRSLFSSLAPLAKATVCFVAGRGMHRHDQSLGRGSGRFWQSTRQRLYPKEQNAQENAGAAGLAELW